MRRCPPEARQACEVLYRNMAEFSYSQHLIWLRKWILMFLERVMNFLETRLSYRDEASTPVSH